MHVRVCACAVYQCLMWVLGQFRELLVVGAGKQGGMLLAAAWGELGLACSSFLVGMCSGQQLDKGDGARDSLGLGVPFAHQDKRGRCWKLSLASATFPTLLGGGSPALTPLGLQASYQALP